MSTERTEPLVVFLCPECGEPERWTSDWSRASGRFPLHTHKGVGGFHAEEVEVIPADSPQVLSVDEVLSQEAGEKLADEISDALIRAAEDRRGYLPPELRRNEGDES
jgi:hypothetical protein